MLFEYERDCRFDRGLDRAVVARGPRGDRVADALDGVGQLLRQTLRGRLQAVGFGLGKGAV